MDWTVEDLLTCSFLSFGGIWKPRRGSFLNEHIHQDSHSPTRPSLNQHLESLQFMTMPAPAATMTARLSNLNLQADHVKDEAVESDMNPENSMEPSYEYRRKNRSHSINVYICDILILQLLTSYRHSKTPLPMSLHLRCAMHSTRSWILSRTQRRRR